MQQNQLMLFILTHKFLKCGHAILTAVERVRKTQQCYCSKNESLYKVTDMSISNILH